MSQAVLKYGALQRIRIPDLLIRSQTLYPAELAAHMSYNSVIISQQKNKIKSFFEKNQIFVNLYFDYPFVKVI